MRGAALVLLVAGLVASPAAALGNDGKILVELAHDGGQGFRPYAFKFCAP